MRVYVGCRYAGGRVVHRKCENCGRIVVFDEYHNEESACDCEYCENCGKLFIYEGTDDICEDCRDE